MPARLLDPQSGACPDGLCFYSQHGHAASRLRTILHKKTKQALGFRFNLPHPLWLAPQIPVNLSFERKKGVKSMSRTRRHCVCVCVWREGANKRLARSIVDGWFPRCSSATAAAGQSTSLGRFCTVLCCRPKTQAEQVTRGAALHGIAKTRHSLLAFTQPAVSTGLVT